MGLAKNALKANEKTMLSLEAEITELRAEVAQLQQQAGNVLARIHGDGGHYIAKHGWEKACKDAEVFVCRLQAQDEELTQLREDRRVLNTEATFARKLFEAAEREADEDRSLQTQREYDHAYSAYMAVRKATNASGALERSK